MQVRKRFTQSLSGRIVWSIFLLTMMSASVAQKVPLKNYTIHDGLPQNTVFDIDQDQMGYIWFATQVGAARFDGYKENFEIFNVSDGLPDDYVNCLMVDREGQVWMGTEGGVAIYNGSGIDVLTEEDGLIYNRIKRMVEDVNGNVWLSTAFGISVIAGDSIYTYSMEDALFDNMVLDIFADSRGRVHVATGPGLTIFQGPHSYTKKYENEYISDIIETSSGEIWYASQENGIFVEGPEGDYRLGYQEGLTDEITLSLMEDSEGRIWCGTYVGGLFIYQDGTFNHLTNSYGSEPIATEIYEDRYKRIWIRTLVEGVWLYDEGTMQHITVTNNLLENTVNDLFEDRYGSVWLATLNGASKYGRVIFEIYDMDLGLPENNIASVFTDSKGRIWFGTYKNLMYKDRDEIYILGSTKGFTGEAMPLSFAEDKLGNIYIGTDDKLLYYNWRSISQVDWWIYNTKHPYSIIYSLLYTSDEKLWCATDSGIHIMHQGKVTILGQNEGLVNQQVNSMEARGDMICCATEGGISIFNLDGELIRNITEDDGLNSNVCNDITHDPMGNIWVATDRGVSRITLGEEFTIENFSIENGLSSNTAYFVEFADSESLWIGTEKGINVHNTREGTFEYYGDEDGFYPLETNARAVSKGSNGELWIGTITGLVHYKPRYNLKDPVPPDLILYPPHVDGELFTYPTARRKSEMVDLSEIPAFQYNKNSLEFSFTGIHTTIPEQNRFTYYLEGYDDEWSEPGLDRSVHYRKLPNGSYIFKVKAINLDGYEVASEASFAFTIKPPFWKTVWFIFFEVLAGLSLVYAIIKYRERQLIREKRVLEQKVRERTKEIEDQKVEIEAQRDEISEQKNYVEDQRDQIAFQNKEITDSIIYAKRIQHAVLPGKFTLERTLPDHFILFKPRDIVSGDFYWVEEKNDQVIVCAADCTGHGVPGAFMSLLGLTFLNEIVNKDEILKAGEILNKLRTYIITSMSTKDGASQGRDGMDMSLIVIDRQLNMLQFAGAYNPLCIMRGDEMIEYKGDKMPVGKHEGEEGPFNSHRIDLKDKDMIYLYSDGFADQFGGEKGSKYKARPFKRLLQRISSEPVEKQSELLEMELNSWMGQIEQVDDILVMGIRYKAGL